VNTVVDSGGWTEYQLPDGTVPWITLDFSGVWVIDQGGSLLRFPIAVREVIEPDVGGTLVMTNSQQTVVDVTVPSSVLTQTTSLVFTEVNTYTTQGAFATAGTVFDLEPYVSGTLVPSLTLPSAVTITLNYSDQDVRRVEEDSLMIYWWDEDGEEWLDAASTCDPPSIYHRDPANNQIAVGVCHLSRYALFGEVKLQVFLPMVVK
jgi:hypothetical protein